VTRLRWLGGAVAVPAWVPPEPDRPTARRLLVEELGDPVYDQQPTLLDRVLRWLGDRLAELDFTAADMDPRLTAAIVVGVLLLGLAIAFAVAGPVRRARRARRPSTDVLGDDTRTAAQLRESADALAAAGDWSGAVLDRFRAVLRSLEERAVLDERPGRTAHEAATEAAAAFPDDAVALRAAGALFDDVRYGDVGAGPDDDRRLRSLDETLAGRTPVRARVPDPEPV